MNPEPQTELDQQIAERFAELPEVVQNAITSADVEKRLRTLADTHKLHLDQWEKLENEVMLSLLGFQNPADLSKNFEKVVGLDAATAETLTKDVNSIVFEPIRAELERQLSHPQAKKAEMTGVETVQSQILSEAHRVVVPPATPPVPAPTEKAVRASISGSYVPQAPSHERKTIEGDPYREQIA